MGSTARGAGSSVDSHPMAVNETVIAMLRPKPNKAKLANDPAEVRATAQAAVDAPDGIGTIASYWTEAPLPATGTWNAPGKGGAQADLVLTAPQDGVPLLFIEVDNCHETAEELADKLEKYARFFRRKMKDGIVNLLVCGYLRVCGGVLGLVSASGSGLGGHGGGASDLVPGSEAVAHLGAVAGGGHPVAAGPEVR
ncbi:replication-relaxation family protein [Streptomyces sanglieri]|uniref:replication-relaxation family protein n=1 Tax=Streptomyces sanglieri TaxID=193460 RepID=UPI003523F5FA